MSIAVREASGQVQWSGNFGSYFGTNTFGKVADPQCGRLATELRAYCTLQAVTDAKTGEILLQNPQPGKRGTLGRQTMYLPGQWSFDASMSKTVRIRESKTVQVRLDATNVLNHPSPGNPSFDINGTTPFGFIQDKGAQRREFKGQVRLSF